MVVDRKKQNTLAGVYLENHVFTWKVFTWKTMVVDRKKKQNALTLLYLASGLQPNTTNSSDVPTEFATLNTTKMTP